MMKRHEVNEEVIVVYLNFAKIRAISIHLDTDLHLFNILTSRLPILQSEKSLTLSRSAESWTFGNHSSSLTALPLPVTVVANKSICISSFLAQLSLSYT